MTQFWDFTYIHKHTLEISEREFRFRGSLNLILLQWQTDGLKAFIYKQIQDTF